MVLSTWLCKSSTKNMLVKIVYPGGHVELHDRPVLAAEIMLRNPRCVVAHPQIFQQPWAIVSPDTTLMLGHKFYVVPISTIRKLQRLPYKFSASSETSMKSTKKTINDDEEQDCCFFMFQNGIKHSCSCMRHSDDHRGSDEETRSWSSSSGSSETRGLRRSKRKEDMKRGSPKRFTSIDYWQPNLESIREE